MGVGHLQKVGGCYGKLIQGLFSSAQKMGVNADIIRENIESNFQRTAGARLKEFETNFTFVSDCVATIHKVFGVSVSTHKIPYSERWVGCISHQFNTVVKHAMGNFRNQKFRKNNRLSKKYRHQDLNEKLDKTAKKIHNTSGSSA